MKKLIVILIAILTCVLFAEDSKTLSPNLSIQKADTPKQIENFQTELLKADNNLKLLIHQAQKEQQAQAKIQRQIQSIPPEQMAALFLKELDKAENPDELLNSVQAKIQKAENTFSLSGNVQVNNESPTAEIRVLAFDKFGYFNGSASCGLNGHYIITDLAAGSYFVLTRSSHYVDELYNDIPIPFVGNGAWRNATQVQVDADVEGIDFDLQPAARITGTIKNAIGEAVSDTTFVEFIITSASDSIPQALRYSALSNGHYEIYVPAMGESKIKAVLAGYEPAWSPNAASWNDGAVVNIAENGQSYNADFQLAEKQSEPTGAISGAVTPAIVAVVFAFDATDTTFAGMGLGLGLFSVNYTIENLPPGEYFVYADDYIGTLIGAQNQQGAYYGGGTSSTSISGAAKVTVTANQTTEFINFSLSLGSSVKGQVTNEMGAPLDSVTIILANKDMLQMSDEPTLTKLELQIITTGFDGRYTITGLKPGNYILRTLVDYALTFNLAGSDLLSTGKHAGLYIDEFNDGEQSLFNILNVEPVPITTIEIVENVNFVLEPANFITGFVTDAATGEPTDKAMIVALQDTSGFPYLPIALLGEEGGNFKLGPLPKGNYKLLALPNFEEDVPYLPEFYSNKRNFWNADVVSLNQPLIENINFALEHGATVQGFIHFAQTVAENFADHDSLRGTPVVAYDAITGKTASYDFVQFNGGYRIDKLIPGEYKISAIPSASQFAAGFNGGASDFASAASIALTAGEVKEKEIILNAATGIIHGEVTHMTSGEALSQVLVCAYDASGHMAGFDMTGFNMRTDQETGNPGAFHISGLVAGQSYYLRTFSLLSNLDILETLSGALDQFGEFDLTGLLNGGLPNFDFNFALQVYGDYWYPEIPATLPFNLSDLIFNLSSFGFANEEDISTTPIFLPLPFAEEVPNGAMMVTAEAGAGTQVDFKLDDAGNLGDVFTGVQDEQIVTEYALQQNYPNPFNPQTTISYQLPQDDHVNLTIFDITGRTVTEIVNQQQTAGMHSVNFNAALLSSGVYLYQLETPNWKQTKQMLLIK